MKNSTKNILVAGLGGIAVGAIAGILFAPASGKETRAAIKTKTNDVVDSMSEKVSAVKNQVENSEPSELIANLKATIESKFKSGKADVKDGLLDQIHKLEEAIKKA